MSWQRECELWPLRWYAEEKLAGWDLDDSGVAWPTRSWGSSWESEVNLPPEVPVEVWTVESNRFNLDHPLGRAGTVGR
jgi:hypothetical protein